MRSFYVLVHGRLDWVPDHSANEEMFTPAGFYCHRYVLASGFEDAAEKAFRRIRKSLEKQTGWLKGGLATLTLEAQEVRPAALRKLLKRGNRRQEFYAAEGAAQDDRT
ncbi:hypothetical protein [Sphingomonas xanthus]|uniref:Uncharacterized protein n=1 Tax=Sphingomonas xanthus TaxID=2594473 RepID=A0A516IQQ3_9SPHN|nr:hypothetical protein [Sphingomonas xanthus]QDP19237.1 hypothetical protein FMM02_04225 [Sphingomonas xanthus]